MKWTREDYIGLMTFEDVGRPMFCELFGPLVGLDEEWRSQGALEEEIDMTAFDFDYAPVMGCGAEFDIFPGETPRVLENTPDYRLERDAYGRVTKLCKGRSTLALPMDYPVTDMDSWLKIKPRFTFREDRINWDKVEAARRAQREGVLIRAEIPGGFDLPRQLMGEENACLCYYEDPELMADILKTIGDTAVEILRRVTEKLPIDNLSAHEDMAGKSGPLVGPGLVREFIGPYYRRVWDLVSAAGTRLFSQDSDGNMNAVADAFSESGVNIQYPAEPAAGMDMVALRERFGDKLAFKGGIDKHVLRQDKEAIRRELAYKLQPSMRWGTVFGLDHRITNGTPIENYRYYVRTAREMLGLPPLATDRRGWGHMAF